MATVRPFKAIRPKTELAEKIASVPYDVVTKEEAVELAADNPLSFLRVIRPEIDLPEGTDLYLRGSLRESSRKLQRFDLLGTPYFGGESILLYLPAGVERA